MDHIYDMFQDEFLLALLFLFILLLVYYLSECYNHSMSKNPKAPIEPLDTTQFLFKDNLKSKVKGLNGLTPRRELFCLEYMRDLNAYKAYRRAGFEGKPDKGVALIMSRPAVRDRIAELKAERAERLKIDGEKVTRMIIDAYEGAMAAGDFSPAVRAAQLLAQHINFFKDHNIQTVKFSGVSGTNAPEDVDKDIERLLPIATYKLKSQLEDHESDDSP